MPGRIRWLFAGMVAAIVGPRPVWAGMPSFTLADARRSFSLALTDPARARLEAISFFLVGLFVCAGVIQYVWNSLRKDAGWLPRLSYGRAFGVVVLWGLLFVLVLTMISGARELMTPGAWRKQGLTYRLKDDPAFAVERQITARFDALERIRERLFAEPGAFGEPFPAELPGALREMPGAGGQHFRYVGGRRYERDARGEARPLVYEGDAYGPDRLVLTTAGEIVWMPVSEIEGKLEPGTP